MALNPAQRAASRLRLERNNDIVNLVVKRETARVDFWEAQTALDQKLLGADSRYRELADNLSDIYRVSLNEVPKPPSSDEEDEEVKEVPAPKEKKKRKKSARQREKSKERLVQLRTQRKRKDPEAELSVTEVIPEETIPEPPVEPPKKKFNKRTGRTGEEEAKEAQEQAAQDEHLNRNKKVKKAASPAKL